MLYQLSYAPGDPPDLDGRGATPLVCLVRSMSVGRPILYAFGVNAPRQRGRAMIEDQRGTSTSRADATSWPKRITDSFTKHGALRTPIPAKSLLSVLHAVRTHSEAMTAGEPPLCAVLELQARSIAASTGLRVSASRWVLQSLREQEKVLFGSGIAPVAAQFDIHGYPRRTIAASDARAATGIVRYFAQASMVAPDEALAQLCAAGGLARPDPGAARRAVTKLAIAARGRSERASVTTRHFDWAYELQRSFDERGRAAEPIDRERAYALLCAIAREANSGPAKCALDTASTWPIERPERPHRLLRRACTLLAQRTHLRTAAHALIAIVALKRASQSGGLFRSLPAGV